MVIEKPATIQQHDLALGIFLQLRILRVLEKDIFKGIPCMKQFLESKGRPTFADLMDWIGSTGCAPDIHIYDGIEICPRPQIPTANIGIVEASDLTWAFKITELKVDITCNHYYYS